MKVKVAQSCPTLCDPMDCTVHGILQARILEWIAFPSPGDLPNPGIEHRSPTLQADFLQVEPQGKPKNTGVGSLSLLQQIFQTQELNRAVLHCRWILYQLSYEGSPPVRMVIIKVKVKVAQSCLTLCDPMDYTAHGILQARILEWVACPFSRDLSNPGIEPRSPTLQVDSLPAKPQGKPKESLGFS